MNEIGIDVVEISRIERLIQNRTFVEKVFSQDEIAFFEKKKFAAQSIAANFAGKEAFAKALGTGISGFSFKEVEVLREDNGKPYIRLSGRALETAKKQGVSGISISLSHDGGIAAGAVILTKDG